MAWNVPPPPANGRRQSQVKNTAVVAVLVPRQNPQPVEDVKRHWGAGVVAHPPGISADGPEHLRPEQVQPGGDRCPDPGHVVVIREPPDHHAVA